MEKISGKWKKPLETDTVNKFSEKVEKTNG